MNVESHIQKALEQAELFSHSLQEAREKEALALKTLEEERVKLSQSFDENSVIIEQIGRELEAATIDELHSYPLQQQYSQGNHNSMSIPHESIFSRVTNEASSGIKHGETKDHTDCYIGQDQGSLQAHNTQLKAALNVTPSMNESSLVSLIYDHQHHGSIPLPSNGTLQRSPYNNKSPSVSTNTNGSSNTATENALVNEERIDPYTESLQSRLEQIQKQHVTHMVSCEISTQSLQNRMLASEKRYEELYRKSLESNAKVFALEKERDYLLKELHAISAGSGSVGFGSVGTGYLSTPLLSSSMHSTPTPTPMKPYLSIIANDDDDDDDDLAKKKEKDPSLEEKATHKQAQTQSLDNSPVYHDYDDLYTEEKERGRERGRERGSGGSRSLNTSHDNSSIGIDNHNTSGSFINYDNSINRIHHRLHHDIDNNNHHHHHHHHPPMADDHDHNNNHHHHLHYSDEEELHRSNKIDDALELVSGFRLSKEVNAIINNSTYSSNSSNQSLVDTIIDRNSVIDTINHYNHHHHHHHHHHRNNLINHNLHHVNDNTNNNGIINHNTTHTSIYDAIFDTTYNTSVTATTATAAAGIGAKKTVDNGVNGVRKQKKSKTYSSNDNTSSSTSSSRSRSSSRNSNNNSSSSNSSSSGSTSSSRNNNNTCRRESSSRGGRSDTAMNITTTKTKWTKLPSSSATSNNNNSIMNDNSDNSNSNSNSTINGTSNNNHNNNNSIMNGYSNNSTSNSIINGTSNNNSNSIMNNNHNNNHNSSSINSTTNTTTTTANNKRGGKKNISESWLQTNELAKRDIKSRLERIMQPLNPNIASTADSTGSASSGKSRATATKRIHSLPRSASTIKRSSDSSNDSNNGSNNSSSNFSSSSKSSGSNSSNNTSRNSSSSTIPTNATIRSNNNNNSMTSHRSLKPHTHSSSVTPVSCGSLSMTGTTATTATATDIAPMISQTMKKQRKVRSSQISEVKATREAMMTPTAAIITNQQQVSILNHNRD